METIIAVVAYLFVIFGFLFIPSFIAFVLCYCFEWKFKRAVRVLLAALAIETGMIVYLSQHPIFICPGEYQDYVERNGAPTRRGIYSSQIPLFVIANQVEYAGDGEVHVRTWYFPLGAVTMGVGRDGYFQLEGLFE
ncbi:MAG: hypothetical protein IJ493_04815 [Clostridia bacterium]|nr:hypothetical protein [Clostridia bacterium]